MNTKTHMSVFFPTYIKITTKLPTLIILKQIKTATGIWNKLTWHDPLQIRLSSQNLLKVPTNDEDLMALLKLKDSLWLIVEMSYKAVQKRTLTKESYLLLTSKRSEALDALMLEEVRERKWSRVDLQAGPGQSEAPQSLLSLGCKLQLSFPQWKPFARMQHLDNNMWLYHLDGIHK